MSVMQVRHGKRDGFPFIFDHEDQELRGLGVTGICCLAMDVAGPFVEGLAGGQSNGRLAVDLHGHGAFQHVNKDLGIVSMRR